MNVPALKGPDSVTQYTNITYFTKGGMGEIYKGTDNIENKIIAVKLIPLVGSDEDILLEREVAVSISLTGKNLVKAHFAGRVEIEGVSYLYIVQDFYSEGNLRRKLREGIELDQCYSMMTDLLMGLSEIHKSVVHRDLKPENILIDDSGSLLITDFGLAKYIDEKTKTRSFKGAGTIPYMAPECWLFERNTPLMDIYSLGIIFFEILTGRLPFNGKSENEWRDFHVYQQLPDISLFRADIPTRLRQIISKMTQKRMVDRFQTAESILSALVEAKSQSVAERKEAERLAEIGHMTLRQIKNEQLKAKQEQDRIVEYCKYLNYHITEYFEKLKELVSSVNMSLEPPQRIAISEGPFKGRLTERKLSISFSGKTISIEFPEWNVIEQAEKHGAAKILEIQKQRYGMVLQAPGPSFIKQKSIIFFGKLECNTTNPVYQERFGYNLVLVKNEGDTYGKWFAAYFSDSSLSRSRRSNFAINLDQFFENFEQAFIMSNIVVDYHEIGVSDYSRVVEEILRK